MASLPSQSSGSHRQASSQPSPPPTPAINRRSSRSSQSFTSEDSQTLLVGTPRSSSPKAASTRPTDGVTSAPSTPSATPPEPRKCWICFSDETEDNPATSEWVSPCPCALTAHQACLLDWVADLQAPNRKAAKKVQCPQCKADIKVAQPRSLSLELARAFDRVSSRLWKGVAGVSVLSAFWGACYMHGSSSLYIMMGRSDYTRLVTSFQLHRRPSSFPTVVASVSCIPIILVLSRTTLADGLFPVLPVLFLFRAKPTKSAAGLWPPSFMMTLYSLPYIRSLYNAFHKRVLAPYEKAWLKGIQPRAGEDTQEANEEAHQHEDGAEGHNDDDDDDAEGEIADFELGVQVEVIEEAEEIHLPPAPPQQPQPEIPAPPAAAAAPNPPNNQQPRPQNPARPAPHGGAIQHNLNFLLNLPSFLHTTSGALLFPSVCFLTGELLRAILPLRFTTRPTLRFGRPGNPTGILQTRWGRSLVGGMLFVVAKDCWGLWTMWVRKEDHKRRRVLNYRRGGPGGEGEVEETRPWWRKSLGEVVGWS